MAIKQEPKIRKYQQKQIVSEEKNSSIKRKSVAIKNDVKLMGTSNSCSDQEHIIHNLINKLRDFSNFNANNKLSEENQILFDKIQLLKENVDKNKYGYYIKNYNKLCEELDLSPKCGSAKKSQITRIQQFCDLQKVKHSASLVIKKIYQEPKLVLFKGTYINFKQFLIHQKDMHSKGVYIIYSLAAIPKIYIGSTFSGFRSRFIQHLKNSLNQSPHTQELLLNNGFFDALWYAPKNTTEKEIREKEQYYIDLFTDENNDIIEKYNFQLVNRSFNTFCLRDIEFKPKSKISKTSTVLRFNNTDLEKVYKLLNKNKIKYSVGLHGYKQNLNNEGDIKNEQ